MQIICKVSVYVVLYMQSPYYFVFYMQITCYVLHYMHIPTGLWLERVLHGQTQTQHRGARARGSAPPLPLPLVAQHRPAHKVRNTK